MAGAASRNHTKQSKWEAQQNMLARVGALAWAQSQEAGTREMLVEGVPRRGRRRHSPFAFLLDCPRPHPGCPPPAGARMPEAG
jgi:hypothetical protein